jgi:hypothetical protein
MFVLSPINYKTPPHPKKKHNKPLPTIRPTRPNTIVEDDFVWV